MKLIKTIDGNEACAQTAYLFTEIAGIYPITPSSPMAEHIDEWSNNNRTNVFSDKVKVVEMQSEAGAAGFIHGSLQNGVLATTFTASQGLLLMIPNMYKMAGEMLPCVMHVAARSLSTHALSIFGDHQDIYAARTTGFCMLASSSVQDASYLSAIAHLSAIDRSLPFLHFFDGFRTSHEINKINVLEKEDYEKLINYNSLNRFRNRALNPMKPNTRGTAQNDDIYFQATEARNSFYDTMPDVVNKYMEKLNVIAQTDYKPFNYYGSSKATKVIIAMGSVCETIKETIDDLNQDIGLIEVHLYRPFSIKYLLNVLPKTVSVISVLDRTKEFGSIGEPLYLDVVSCINSFNKSIKVVGGRYGLSSKNTTPSQIKAVYDMMDNPKNNFTIGIEDDVTNLSLKEDNYNIINNKEMLIYGYGSDGMISASKSIIKLIGDNTDNYVQGYFQYDSKKSGGVTISHLRLSNKKILSTYYVSKPLIVVVSKDSYLGSFEIVKSLMKNSILIINTNKSEKELVNEISDNLKNILIKNNAKIYTINAYDIAKKVGLSNKISMIMECAILYITKIINFDFSKKKMIEYIKDTFSKKGDSIIKANIDSLDLTINTIKEIKLQFELVDEKNENNLNICETMFKREGNKLPTSAFLNNPTGIFAPGTSVLENKVLSNLIPKYISQNCINCNQCSFVCPHSVIRPFVLSINEYNEAPEYIKVQCKKLLGKDNYYFTIGINIKKCTGCGLCIKTCPSKNKALIYEENNKTKQPIQQTFEYLEKNIKNKNLFNNNTVIGSQFTSPKFEYCGACAGCGEVAYIKLLTQLYGDNLIIANATGCSSIYGGSAPSTPYKISWASSLFEDNAEYGYGMLISNEVIRNRIKIIMEQNIDNENKPLFEKWLNNMNNYEITKEVYNNLTDNIPKSLFDLKEYIPSRNYWCIGGDGWAYDIGYGGIDHVLSTNDNINILVLDTQVYSNTGGQASKSSEIGSIASFATSGKTTRKKDLARIVMQYPNVYVAQISLGANMMQVLQALKEANDYNGPSIVIAYSPCISHGYIGGMSNSVEMQKLATECGYFPIFRRHPVNGFVLDSKKVDFNKYDEFLNSQTRYSMLNRINVHNAKELLEQNKKNAVDRFNFYKKMDELKETK